VIVFVGKNMKKAASWAAPCLEIAEGFKLFLVVSWSLYQPQLPINHFASVLVTVRLEVDSVKIVISFTISCCIRQNFFVSRQGQSIH